MDGTSAIAIFISRAKTARVREGVDRKHRAPSKAVTQLEIKLREPAHISDPMYFLSRYLSNSLAYNDTFVLSGGYGSLAHSDDIWKFENSNITWKKLTQALVRARTSAAAMLVPKSFCKAA